MATFNKSQGIAGIINSNVSTNGSFFLEVQGADEFSEVVFTPSASTPTNGDSIQVSYGLVPGLPLGQTYAWVYTGGVWTNNFCTATIAGMPPSPYMKIPPGCGLVVYVSIASGAKLLAYSGIKYKNFVN